MTHLDISYRKVVARAAMLWLASAGVLTVPAFATTMKGTDPARAAVLAAVLTSTCAPTAAELIELLGGSSLFEKARHDPAGTGTAAPPPQLVLPHGTPVEEHGPK